jgi:hypothetical protein
MDHEPRTRLLREYLWFALILVAILMGAALQQPDNTALDSHSTAALSTGCWVCSLLR